MLLCAEYVVLCRSWIRCDCARWICRATMLRGTTWGSLTRTTLASTTTNWRQVPALAVPYHSAPCALMSHICHS